MGLGSSQKERLVMASKKFAKDSKEFAFFADFWKLAQEYYIPDDSDEYWEALMTSTMKLEKKYPGRFYKSLIHGFLDYAEKENKFKLHGEE